MLLNTKVHFHLFKIFINEKQEFHKHEAGESFNCGRHSDSALTICRNDGFLPTSPNQFHDKGQG